MTNPAQSNSAAQKLATGRASQVDLAQGPRTWQEWREWGEDLIATHSREQVADTLADLGEQVYRLRLGLGESHGSYMALVANLEGLAKGARGWDGPTVARQMLGLPDA